MRIVAVIGSGTMGSGIAQVCAQTGWETRLYDAFPDSLEKGMNSIGEFWKGGIARGKNTEEQVNEWSNKLIPCENLEKALTGVDLVIEAVPEKIELKRSMFKKIEDLAPGNAILATNTSGLNFRDCICSGESGESGWDAFLQSGTCNEATRSDKA